MTRSKNVQMPSEAPGTRPMGATMSPEGEGMARSQMTNPQNESTPMDQRTARARSKAGPGPRVGAAGERLPAVYDVKHVVVEDGKRRVVQMRREDR